MALFERRERTKKTIEYVVPSGSPMGEFSKAERAARQEHLKLYGEAGRDDWARVRADDEHVVIWFEAPVLPASARP